MASSPHVLYYCPCDQASASTSFTSRSSSSSSSVASPPPGLPAYSPAARYNFHALDSLYFCDECDQVRCNRCVTVDISSYYCPNCLFEVPGASLKAEKNRCARNCFECPCCQHTLSVLASDLASDAGLRINPTDPAASQGESPYYLGCSFCRWDSKSIGLVFEKPTGLSLQLQRNEDNSADVLEFDRLKDHFDPYIKAQTQAAIISAAVGSSGTSAARLSPNPTTPTSSAASSSNAPTSSRNARVAAARNAAAAALQSSKLVRDLPHLAHSKHLGVGGSTRNARSAPIEPDELRRYRALNPWQPSSDARGSSSIGVVAKREKHRRDYLSRLQSLPGQPFASLDQKISSLEQRWSSISIADQPVRAADLHPTRVPLKSKISKRCPACRHIVIKPDIKAASNRFKIKLVALNFLPEIQINLAPQQPFLDPLRFRSAAGLTGAATSTLRRRPPSVLVSGTDSLGAASSLMITSKDIDTDRLEAGHTYSFQINVSNPLDDAIQVELSFVRFALPSRLSGGDSAVQPLPQPSYIFSATEDIAAASPPKSQLSDGQQSAHPSKRSRLGWQVYPSTTSLPLKAFNEVWDLEDAEDMYSSETGDVDAQEQSSVPSQHHSAVRTAVARATDISEESPWFIEEEQDGEDNDAVNSNSSQRKPFVQKGHSTTFYLDLAISANDPPRAGPLELAMHVIYRYTPDIPKGGDKSSAPTGKDFSFWTSLRLGTVSSIEGHLAT